MYIYIKIYACEYVHFDVTLSISKSIVIRNIVRRRCDVFLFTFFLSLDGSRFLERTVVYPWRAACFPYGPSNLERTVEEEPGPVLWEHTRLNTCVSLPAADRKSL